MVTDFSHSDPVKKEHDFFAAFNEDALNSGDQSRPKYERLRDCIVSRIESGELESGYLLPSEHHLAEVLGVARNTVRQAMVSLEQDGLVRRVHGKGTFIEGQARKRLRKEQALLALIVPETRFGFYPALQRSFEQAAAELHSQVVVCNSDNEIERQGNSILQLIHHRVSGVAIVPTTDPVTPAFHVQQLQQHGIPVVCCGRRVPEAETPLLAIPFEEVGRRAGEAILNAGHRKIACINGYRYEATEAYERGLRAALEQDGNGEASLTTFYGKTLMTADERDVEVALDELYGEGDGPTAIFASFDSLAELIYIQLSQRGLRVPEDVSLVGFGGSHREGGLLRRLTSVILDEDLMGRRAVDFINMMRRGKLPIDTNETQDIPLGISDGHTLAKPAESVSLCPTGQ